MQLRAAQLAEEVERLAVDPSSAVLPAASRALIIVTGAVLVRQPRAILQPVCALIEVTLGTPPPDVQHAFQGDRGPALADLPVDTRHGGKA